MSYIGSSASPLPVNFAAVQAQSFNGTGSQTAFTLSRTVPSAASVEVLVNNVQQSPYDGSYSISGTTLTFSEAPSSGTNNVYVVYRDQSLGSLVDATAYRQAEADARFANLNGGTFLGPVNLPSGGLNVGSGQLRVDSSGRVLKNAQPAFFAGVSANWTHPSGVQKVAATYSAPVNVGGHFDTGTKRFTAPVAGTYLMCATVGTIGGAGTFNYLSSEIWVNGAGRIRGGWDGGGPSYGQTSTSGIVVLAAGDYVELYCEASKTFIVEGGSGSATYLSGYLLG